MKPWLAQTAIRHPNRSALFWRDDALTYRELAERTARFASTLADAGIRAGDRVGLLAENSRDALLAIHATFWRGATLVPFNPRLNDETLAAQIKEIAPEVILTDGGDCRTNGGERYRALDTLPGSSDTIPPEKISSDSLATIMFTSGTTGEPRPVPLTYDHHRESAACSAFNLGVDPRDRWLGCLPLYHVGGLATAIRSVIYGTAVDLMATFEADEVADRLADNPVTLVSFVPTMMRRLVDADRPSPDSLRAVLVGGGPTDPSLVEASRRLGYPVLPTWGMTETSSQFATTPLDPDARRPGTVGPPLLGGELRIVDGDAHPRKPGETGHIQVRGPTVFDGYFRRPERNREVFVDGWFDTGDVGYVDERGHLTVDGRASARIVSGGENVDPREVETVLRRHPTVDEAVVVGVDDPEWGQVVAAAVESSETAATPEALTDHCRRHLAGFKCPSQWRITERLPRTGSEKPDRGRIRESFDATRDED